MKSLKLDPNFKPIILELKKFNQDVLNYGKSNKITIAVRRQQGYVHSKTIDVFPDGVNDQRNILIVERYIKSVLWICGGYEIYISGSKIIYDAIKSYYSLGGLRDFDMKFFFDVYDKYIEVFYVEEKDLPKNKEASLTIGGFLEGKRVGFDAGGSDRKSSAVVNGESIFSEEVVWLPKLSEDYKYQYDGIYQGMKSAISALGGDCDAIGISTAGVTIDNEIKVSSLFIKIPKEDYKDHVNRIYIDVVHQLEEELGHPIPMSVANDGDVTALAGSIDLKDGGVLGIAMGTSEAGGYVNLEGRLMGWINELAFVPLDLNKDAMVDEWSLDYGVGCKYLSQDAVIKLAKPAGIELDDSLTLAEKLKYVQSLMEKDDERAKEIYHTIGVYLAYALAYYQEFYQIKHLLILGRVTSGKGGDIILDVAKKTIKEDFPEYKDIDISMPSEYVRRIGQSVAAASLAKK